MIATLVSLLLSSAVFAQTTYVEQLQTQIKPRTINEQCHDMCISISDVMDQQYQQCMAGCMAAETKK